jgi:hypothetical protein
VDLVVAQVREESGEERRLGDVLPGVGRVIALPKLRVAGLRGRPLVGAASGAEDAIRDVVGAMVTPHGP